MGLSWSHILIVVLLFVLLFGRGKISELMGDLAQGIKSFKKGMSDDDEAAAPPPEPEPKIIEHKPTARPKPASKRATAKAPRSSKSG